MKDLREPKDLTIHQRDWCLVFGVWYLVLGVQDSGFRNRGLEFRTTSCWSCPGQPFVVRTALDVAGGGVQAFGGDMRERGSSLNL